MAVNERFGSPRELRTRSMPVPAGTVSGQPVNVGSFVGVALTDRAVGGNKAGGNPDGFATVAIDGAFDLPVTGAIAGTGIPVYIPVGGGALTATVGSNVVFGYALPGATSDGSKGSGTGTLTVEIARV